MTRCFLLPVLLFISFMLSSQVPTPSILVSPAVLCSAHSATYTSASPSIAVNAYSWSVSPATGASLTGSGTGSVAVIDFVYPGRYTISLKWDFGILGSSTKTISSNVVKSAESAFNASLTGFGNPNEIVLSDFSQASSKIYWVFDKNYSVKDSALHTSKLYSSPGTYTVTHIALGSQGCNDSSSYTFKIAELSKLELPNIFTPNNDGSNDIFRPMAEGITSLHVMIFNRNGTMVKEWETVNGFWDGYTSSGVACDPGTYFVIAEGKGFDGKEYKLKTSLSLSR